MRIVLHGRRLVALLCVAALLGIVLTPTSCVIPFSIPGPVWFFVELLVLVSILRRTRDRQLRLLPVLSTISTRAPPVQ
jgi:hypothetical protein